MLLLHSGLILKSSLIGEFSIPFNDYSDVADFLLSHPVVDDDDDDDNVVITFSSNRRLAKSTLRPPNSTNPNPRILIRGHIRDVTRAVFVKFQQGGLTL